MEKLLVGFIGQGWIGKNYADDFENRGYELVRYSLEEPYLNNKEKIKDCKIVFIAVPTPTKPQIGFDDSLLKDALRCVGKGSTAVIKSTILPGTSERLQNEFPDIYIMHSPEFLREKTAIYNAAHPERNIIGIPHDNEEYRRRAEEVLEILPKAPFQKICHAKDAEIIKYAGNVYLYIKVVYANILHDLVEKQGGDWETVREAMVADPRIGDSHLYPVHASSVGTKSGRGAGGHCFIKDFAAFTDQYEKLIDDKLGVNMLNAIRDKNLDLLLSTDKDIDIVKDVYGEDVESVLKK
jgi:UDPglucose 6-dehydrogenase